MRVFVLLLMFFVVSPVFASGGSYDISVGFESEPVVAEERNALIMSVRTMSGDPVSGLENTIEIEVALDDIARRFAIESYKQPGMYRVDIIPTASGAWEVRVIGESNGETVYEVFSCASGNFACVQDRSILGFPSAAIESASLTKRLSELEVGVANVTASDPMSFFGVIAGVLGLLAGGAALIRRKD